MTQSNSRNRLLRTALGVVGLVVAIVIFALVTNGRWTRLRGLASGEDTNSVETAAVDPHAGHDHGNGSPQATSSIELSKQGLKNIGFEPLQIEPTAYVRTLTLPAIVVERPGRSQIHITAPLTGIVSTIHAVKGEAVGPGDLLFELRLTHEELVTAQRDFLTTSANLGIVNQEILRLEGLGEGVIAGRRILEQKYEKQKLEVALMAEEQAMLLHGLSEVQVREIGSTRRLFRSIAVHAPEHTDSEEACQGPHLYTIQSLTVSKGEQVDVGRELAVLADHCELHVEGIAFEDDAQQIRNAARERKEVTARLLTGDSPGAAVGGLAILYVADQIDPTSRALKVYLSLPNEVALDRSTGGKQRFLEWRYKPGQRMRISLPVETWENQLVVPSTAIVDEAAEAYVYRQNGDHFDQVPVHVLHRDQDAVVLANDGSLFPGDIIAGHGAFQMHLAFMNQSGGGIDPHAGHNH